MLYDQVLSPSGNQERESFPVKKSIKWQQHLLRGCHQRNNSNKLKRTLAVKEVFERWEMLDKDFRGKVQRLIEFLKK
jgi:hypothetical protein